MVRGFKGRLPAWALIALDIIDCIDDIAIMSDALPVASITVRGLAPALKERLRVRAAEHGHSMEAEARRILQAALGAAPEPALSLYARVHARFAPLGGLTLDLPPRELVREPPRFD